MQIYYFSRTGRSKAIAEEMASRCNTAARIIDDHRDWSGKVNYMKAGAMALSGKTIPVDYIEPDADDEIIVVFPLWAGTMPPGVKTFVDTGGKERISGICKENLLIFASKEKIVPWKRQRQMRTTLSSEHINPGRT